MQSGAIALLLLYGTKSHGITALTFNRSCPGLGTTRLPAIGSPPLVSKAICVGRVPMVSVALSNPFETGGGSASLARDSAGGAAGKCVNVPREA